MITLNNPLITFSAGEITVVDGGKPNSLRTWFIPSLFQKVKWVDNPWPKEFSWEFIGQQFQRGYEACTGDWVLHMDLDFIFHEKDFQAIREFLSNYDSIPAVAFPKRQFFVRDKYNVKSNLVLAVNKKVFGNAIRFDGGGDLCQPTLYGKYIDPHHIKRCKIPFYNYTDMWKTKEQIMEDKGRFARAWHQQFGDWKLGGPDDQSAYDAWWEMVRGRFKKHTEKIEFVDHPKVIQESLANLRPDQFGYDGFGLDA